MSLETNFRINIFHKRYTHHNGNSINLLIIDFIILANFQAPLLFHNESPYSFYEVNCVLNLSENYPSKDGVFGISLSEKGGLLEYGGFEPYYQEREQISDYLKSSNISKISDTVIKKHPDTKEILVYINDFNLYTLKDQYLLLKTLLNNQLIYDDTINVYKIY